ncbi:MAG: hypothetical protein ACLQUY_20230 [Ktedonobacterales bacterium]
MNDQWRTTFSAVRQRAREWWHAVHLGLVGTPRSGEPEPEPEPQAPATMPGSPLYQHTAHRQRPRDVNHLHRTEQQTAGFNTRVAVWLTKNVGTMQCAYLFAGIGIGSLVGVATNNVVLAAVFGSLSSYFLQLVLLPILSVGQNVLGRHQELQSDEMFKTSQRSFHDIEEIMAHLSAQDAELLKHTTLLLQLCGGPVATSVPAASTQAVLAPKGRKGKQHGADGVSTVSTVS